MKKLTILLLVLMSALNLFAQDASGNITGKVTDNTGQKPIDAATISLYKSADSSLVKINLSDKEGKFYFENIASGNYYIAASFVGYAKVFSENVVVNAKSITNVGTLQLAKNETALKGVVISAKKPLIERKIDRTIINVDASITNAGTTALEVLEKSPGVTVDKDGNVSLKGKSGVMIMLDGRPSYLSGQELANLLKNMSSSNIDQIEIMTNPPAKFDASGNSGVINIKTKKNKTKGINGSLSAGIMQSRYTTTNNSLNLNYRTEKFNVFGNYSYSFWQRQNLTAINRRFRDASKDVETIFDQNATSERSSNVHNLKAGIDFYASKKTTIGGVFSGYVNPSNKNEFNRTNLLNRQYKLDSVVTSLNTEDELSQNISTNLNLRHIFDSTGKEFSIDLDYINYVKKSDMQLSSNYLNADLSKRRPSSILTGKLPSNVAIYSAKSDFTFPVTKNMKIETGVKTSFVTTDNDALYETGEAGKKVIDEGKTNHFIYKENINAGYINFNTQIKKWGLQAGLRAENTNANGNQKGNLSHQDSSFTKNYTNLFPTLYVSYSANKKNTFSVNYGRRIDRPDYEDLNPFLYFIDEYTYSIGNTLLQPQFSDNFEFTHTYNGFLNTTLNYSETHNAFTQVIKQITSERKTFQTTENLATKKNYGIAISAGFPVMKFWNTNIYGNIGTTEFKGVVDGGILDVSQTMFMTNVSNQFKLSNGWSAELSGFYRSKGIEGQIVIDALWRMDAGVQKQILKNKGSLKLSVRDLFNSMNSTKASINYQDIDLNIDNRRDSRTVSLTFSYRFGKPLKNGRPRKSGASDEESRIKSSGN